MPERSKQLFIASMNENPNIDVNNEEEKKFISTHRNLVDFKIGLIVPGKLLPKRIRGGTLLVETTYEMR